MVREEVGFFEVQLAGSNPDSESIFSRLMRELYKDWRVLSN
jgi:hypothetical protein